MPQPGSVHPAKRRMVLFTRLLSIIVPWFALRLIGGPFNGQGSFDGFVVFPVMVMIFGWESWQQRRAEGIGSLIRPGRWALGRSTREYAVALAGFLPQHSPSAARAPI